jgi:formate dehydrogenase
MEASLRDLLDDFPRERTWVLPALLRIQQRFGHVSSEAIETIARHLRLTPSDVDGIASGYPEIHRSPRARINVRVCEGLSCVLAGAEDLALALEPGTVTDVQVSRVSCLFACALAPVVAVGARCLGRASQRAISDAIARDQGSSTG